MTFEVEKYKIVINEDSEYTSDSNDNVFNYAKEYLTESDYQLPTKYGIRLLENEIEINSVIIGAENGATGLHETSQIIEENRIIICCCDSVFCLALPTLNLNWKTKTDEITSFEILKIDNGYIVHGELEITRIDNNGKIIWQNGGADIFVTPDGTGNFNVEGNTITVTDFEKKTYKWNLDGMATR